MNRALRKLHSQPHGDVALKAFLQFRNLVEPGPRAASEVENSIASNHPQIAASETLAAIHRGFRPARQPNATRARARKLHWALTELARQPD